MRILLVNPPYRAVTSKLGVGEQAPLGLLSIGGPLIDAGHRVRLIDGEARHLGLQEIVREAKGWLPDAILTGHSGSTPAHPTAMRMTRALKEALPESPIVYASTRPTMPRTSSGKSLRSTSSSAERARRRPCAWRRRWIDAGGSAKCRASPSAAPTAW
jgi:hypothetical protein